MNFIVRILFSGLMAVVPNQDGTELTVLLLNVPHEHQLSDDTPLPQHKPLLLARAGTCTGTCPTRDEDIAEFVYADLSQSAALDSLESAVEGGGAWQLASSDVSIRKGSPIAAELPELSITTGVRGTEIIPTTAAERADFSWVADMSSILSGYTLDSDVLASEPPSNLVVARLRLTSGNVFTYSVAKIGGSVTPVHFQRIDGQGSVPSYSQAVASWIGADIEVSGDSIEIVEESFDGLSERSMTLTPDSNGRIEIAVVNLPPFVPPASAATSTDAGKHFEMYYDLAESPASSTSRLVPKAGAASGAPSYSSVNWQSIHPSGLYSELLNQLRMNIGRTLFEQVLCPPATP